MCSAIRVLATMPTICITRMSRGNWSALLLTHPPARFRGARPWSRMSSDFNPPPIGRPSPSPRTGRWSTTPDVGAAESALTWMDRSGKELSRIGEPAVMDNPTLSPDGSRVALDISDEKANNVDIWIESTTGAGNSRFTFDPSEEVVAVWSRDGNTLAYRLGHPDGASLFLKPATGLEAREEEIHLCFVHGRHFSQFLVDGRPADSCSHVRLR